MSMTGNIYHKDEDGIYKYSGRYDSMDDTYALMCKEFKGKAITYWISWDDATFGDWYIYIGDSGYMQTLDLVPKPLKVMDLIYRS